MQALTDFQDALGDRYQLEDELGSGGQGTVFRARDLRLSRPVAIKFLRPDIAPLLGPDRFQREIGIAASLSHPNIVPLLDSGGEGEHLFYTMPLVEGESLRRRLTRHTQLPLEDALQITTDVASALDYAHKRGYIHRDIKPENIVLTEQGAIVLDFGIARAIEVAGESAITSGALALGTPLYMSPEQASGQQQLDGRSDIYALGCVLYEMLAGEPPFTGATPQAVVARHLVDPPPKLSVVRRSVTPALEEAIEKALAKVPADRYASAAEMVQALRKAQRHPGGRALIRRRLKQVALVGVLAMVAMSAYLTWPSVVLDSNNVTAFQGWSAPMMDQSLYMVLPFRHRAASAPRLLNGDQCESLLHDALGRWRGVHLVDPLWVADARSRRGGGGSIRGRTVDCPGAPGRASGAR